jgi:hypothetical protein
MRTGKLVAARLGATHRLCRLAGVGDAEWDLGGLLARDVDPADLAGRPQHDGPGIRRPGDAGVDAVDRPGLLHVPLEAVVDGALDAGVDVLDEENGLRALASDEGERLPVG